MCWLACGVGEGHVMSGGKGESVLKFARGDPASPHEQLQIYFNPHQTTINRVQYDWTADSYSVESRGCQMCSLETPEATLFAPVTIRAPRHRSRVIAGDLTKAFAPIGAII